MPPPMCSADAADAELGKDFAAITRRRYSPRRRPLVSRHDDTAADIARYASCYAACAYIIAE